MKRTILSFVGSLFLASLAHALPPTPHLAKGTVAAIATDTIVLAATADSPKDKPATFAIQAGRTRLREDGKKKTTVETLKVGQPVRIYYRKEMGVWVATDVSWKRAS